MYVAPTQGMARVLCWNLLLELGAKVISSSNVNNGEIKFINGITVYVRGADSPDSLRRQRGRRGMEVLSQLQKETIIPVRITDIDVEGVREVDDKLVILARQLKCPILTNDYNLNRVAELQGVVILNINELANAVKSVVLPGEVMSWPERWRASLGVWPIVAIFLIVFGGIYGGLFTPTEDGGAGALAAFLIGLVRREITGRDRSEYIGAKLAGV